MCKIIKKFKIKR